MQIDNANGALTSRALESAQGSNWISTAVPFPGVTLTKLNLFCSVFFLSAEQLHQDVQIHIADVRAPQLIWAVSALGQLLFPVPFGASVYPIHFVVDAHHNCCASYWCTCPYCLQRFLRWLCKWTLGILKSEITKAIHVFLGRAAKTSKWFASEQPIVTRSAKRKIGRGAMAQSSGNRYRRVCVHRFVSLTAHWSIISGGWYYPNGERPIHCCRPADSNDVGAERPLLHRDGRTWWVKRIFFLNYISEEFNFARFNLTHINLTLLIHVI